MLYLDQPYPQVLLPQRGISTLLRVSDERRHS
jgi:hypothetical protein